MAKKTTDQMKLSQDVPETLDRHPFYGLILDDDQKAFRDAIWDRSKLIVLCDARSGSGKTTIATATANLLVQHRLYDGISYVASPVQEQRQGYLKGDLDEKSEPYFTPFYQALQKIGVNTNTCMADDISNLKNGTGYISCMTHTFLRGTNFENRVVILDEFQNFTLSEAKKTLSRMHDTCKIICVGHNLQRDINDCKNAFQKCIELYGRDERAFICTLTKNYRGWISEIADSIED